MPAPAFRPLPPRASIVARLGAAIIFSTIIWLSSDSRADPCCAGAPANPPLAAEQACQSIRSALGRLARAEHAQAFALDLSAGEGGSAPMVAPQLALLLERSDDLRDILRNVRQDAPVRDPRVQDCMNMGMQALGEAEHLTTTVEEVLYGDDAPNARIRSDASPTAPAAGQP
ncbi:MAG TPA: hypothetical protein VNF29_02060 [Candidatus Binataceae bacterium]|nr:hypothetical protein [Candidatus Binataceae bacterium]